MARSIPEWIAKTDDDAVPVKVQLRILDRQRPEPNALPICPECTRPIRTGDGKPEFDHKRPLIDGGAHSEHNLRAVHPKCHKLKTAREAQSRAEARSHQANAYGLRKSKVKWPKRPMAGYASNARQLYGDIDESEQPMHGLPREAGRYSER